MLYEARELAIMDEMARIDGARSEGLREGLREGRRENALEIAKKLLKSGMKHEMVAENTDLTLDEITAIR